MTILALLKSNLQEIVVVSGVALAMGFSGGFYTAHEFAKADAEGLANKQQAVTVNAQNNVIKKQQRAEKTTVNTEQEYEKAVIGINSDYDASVQPPTTPASGSLPAVPSSAPRACPSSSIASKAYKLTLKQCDVEEAKLQHLWAWYAEQSK